MCSISSPHSILLFLLHSRIQSTQKRHLHKFLTLLSYFQPKITLRPPSLLQSWSSPVHPEVLFPCRIGPLFRQIFDKNFSREGGHPPPFTLPPPLTRPSASEYSVYRFLVLLGWQLCHGIAITVVLHVLSL